MWSITARSADYDFVVQERSTTIPLSCRWGVKLLDATAEVAAFPGYAPGRTEISLPLDDVGRGIRDESQSRSQAKGGEGRMSKMRGKGQ